MNNDRVHNYAANTYWSEEDGCFLAEIPELPGCIADGATAEEARRNLQVMAEDWVKMAAYMGREVPAPQPLVPA